MFKRLPSIIAVAILAPLITGCASRHANHNTPSSTDPHNTYGFVSESVWISGCIEHPRRIVKIIADHSWQFDHCQDRSLITSVELGDEGTTFYRQDELHATVKVLDSGYPFTRLFPVDDSESPLQVCYRKAMEMIGFPRASCTDGYTIVWYPNRENKTKTVAP